MRAFCFINYRNRHSHRAEALSLMIVMLFVFTLPTTQRESKSAQTLDLADVRGGNDAKMPVCTHYSTATEEKIGAKEMGNGERHRSLYSREGTLVY